MYYTFAIFVSLLSLHRAILHELEPVKGAPLFWKPTVARIGRAKCKLQLHLRKTEKTRSTASDTSRIGLRRAHRLTGQV